MVKVDNILFIGSQFSIINCIDYFETIMKYHCVCRTCCIH